MQPMDPTRLAQERLLRVSRMLEGYVTRGELSGAGALIGIGSEIAYREAFGMQNREAATPLTTDTLFRIMSMTKPVTAMAAMLLYEEGHFDLNTPIHKFLPAYKRMKLLVDRGEGKAELEETDAAITFRHLFTHTSGISYGSQPDDRLDLLYREALAQTPDDAASETIQDFARKLADLPLAFVPGSQWRYGFNLDVLGALVETIAEQPLEEFMRERIFKPLGMVDTGFTVPEQKAHRLAVVYRRDSESGALVPSDVPIPLAARMWGGGGLVSTLDDYGRFAAMLANGGETMGTRLLSPTTAAMFGMNWATPEAVVSFLKANPAVHGGYGFGLGGAVLLDPTQTGMFGNPGEYYWGGAFSTYFWVDPRLSLYGVVMTQFSPNWGYPIPWQFKQLVYQALVN